MTLLPTCCAGFLLPRINNGGRLMNIWEREIKAMQLVTAMLGLTDFPMPVFFLNAMWIIYFLAPLWQSHATRLHIPTIISCRWSPEPRPLSWASLLKHNPMFLISYSASLLKVPQASQLSKLKSGITHPSTVPLLLYHLPQVKVLPSPQISQARRKFWCHPQSLSLATLLYPILF